ncbi:MFS transporter [Leptospira wolffii]|uniref:MFS transporter n=1 Tax=Leptospira wolffii TaxID=409998 RepID=A0A2M9Z7B3_9LEPT|nr:MFS transporter [Leptospira wolffii]PJZ64316.1 MFS transporter [Leptospira wolffii]TGK58279.1 MFS transporter [Leptospira wolffii]TGK66344.1 MFS transporter [Leptospira wolffii]TGK68957.1 MFS transporter [Leptospira wolffii]TGL27309.1 MFS transporter [Leptospira wolffii]
MRENQVKVYGYRWVILGLYALITAIIQIQWLTLASVARDAKLFYGVSGFQIDLLSMIFLAVFVLIAIPASYVIDTYGIRIGVGIGAVLTGGFGFLKGLYASDFNIVLLSQIGLAIAQPFILNAVTKVSVQWFPIMERATAVALGTLAQFVGIIIVMILTPRLIGDTNPDPSKIPGILLQYGIVSLAGAVIFLAFFREKPPTSPSTHGEDSKIKVFEGLKHILNQKDMQKALLLFLIGLGIFNAISTCIDQICEQKGLNMTQSGDIAGMMLMSGIIGGIFVPLISDKVGKRQPFLLAAMAGFLPGILLLAFAQDYALVLTGAFLIGFFLLGIGAPIGFQYCAEITSPAPESSSQGLLLLIGQVSGIAFIVGMDTLGMGLFLKIFIGLGVVNLLISFLLKESPMMDYGTEKVQENSLTRK